MSLLLCAPYARAQDTSGKEFWVTFGQNYVAPISICNFQIRIVSSNATTSGTIYFTHLDESVPFNMGADEVYTYDLTNDQKLAVYNTEMGITDYSIRITSNDNPVTVYALCVTYSVGEGTNVFPVDALGTDYYQISYSPYYPLDDAYAVVATQNNTQLYHNGEPIEKTLNVGEVYYRTLNSDMTGARITASHPVAFFAVNQYTSIPEPFMGSATSGLMQQLAPIKTWGKNFFVPVSHITSDRVRIVASQNGTNITQAGGTVMSGNLTNLQAGDFVELKISDATGCYIESNNRIGVCSYLTSEFVLISSPAQCWIPALDQAVSHTRITPFIPSIPTYLSAHHALVCTPTATRDNTTVSVGGLPPTSPFGGSWIDNGDPTGMSFYTMPLESATASYFFSNPKGLIILCYGGGINSSYYYLAGSAMRDLNAAFTANYIPYNALFDHLFCEEEITFVANIQGIHSDAGSLKWYINNVLQTDLTDQLTWSKTFAIGNHVIKMEVKFEDESTETYEGTLKIESCGEDPAFYANDIHHQDLPNTTFCDKKVNFRAEIDEEDLHPDAGHLKWFINGIEEPLAQDQLEWSRDFEDGTYPIKMEVRFANGETTIISSTMKVKIFWMEIRNVRY